MKMLFLASCFACFCGAELVEMLVCFPRTDLAYVAVAMLTKAWVLYAITISLQHNDAVGMVVIGVSSGVVWAFFSRSMQPACQRILMS
jgi:hypothetical protein